jgi:hypothetical protein
MFASAFCHSSIARYVAADDCKQAATRPRPAADLLQKFTGHTRCCDARWFITTMECGQNIFCNRSVEIALLATEAEAKRAGYGAGKSTFACLSDRLIDVCEKRLGYRHTLTMQWGGKVVEFESFPVGGRHLAPHVTVNQLILDGPHFIEFTPVDQKFLFKSGLVRLR